MYVSIKVSPYRLQAITSPSTSFVSLGRTTSKTPPTFPALHTSTTALVFIIFLVVNHGLTFQNKSIIKRSKHSSIEFVKAIIFCHQKNNKKALHEIFLNPQHKCVACQSPIAKLMPPYFNPQVKINKMVNIVLITTLILQELPQKNTSFEISLVP